MTSLRRNLIRLWMLFSALWLAYILSLVVRHGVPDEAELPFILIVVVVPPFIVFLVGIGLTRIWERFAEDRWRRLLPQHQRIGLVRLYTAIGVPWVAWFGYHILDALDRNRPVSGAFWSLLIVPVGGPISLALIIWVADGFCKSGSRRGQKDANSDGWADQVGLRQLATTQNCKSSGSRRPGG
jgi:hypothetical protein